MLRLPGDFEPFLDEWDDVHRPSVYCLTLHRPEDPATAWDRHYEQRPPWFPRFESAERVAYVGATGDLLSRLEDHARGDVRQASILRVCDIDGLHGVWLCDSPTKAFEQERQYADALSQERPGWYVHAR